METKIIDPLQSHLVLDGTERYLIGYRAITLLSPTTSQQSPYINTVSILVNEGSLTCKNIEIHAEDVYIYAGTTFNFPGKNVVLTANRIIIVRNHQANDATGVTFNCNGGNASALTGAGSTGANGADASIRVSSDFSGRRSWSGDEPKNGADGGDGTSNTSNGSPGGCFVLLARLRHTMEKSVSFYTNCTGGTGSRGQDGGNGGKGGNGAHTDDRADRPDDKYVKAGSGGRGGRGGQGSAGGNGGFIFDLSSALSTLDDSQAKSGLTEDFQKSSTQATTLSRITKSSLDLGSSNVAAGTPGSGGSAGAGGARGTKGHWREWWVELSDSELLETGGSEEGDGPEGVDGASGSVGDTGTATASPGYIFPANFQDKEKLPTTQLATLCPDPMQLAMVLRRLLFEYQVLSSAQAMDAHDEGENLPRRRWLFQHSADWLGAMIALVKDRTDSTTAISAIDNEPARTCLNHCLSRLPGTQDVARTELLDSYQKFIHLTSAALPLDIYGQRLNYIAEPNLKLDDLKLRIDGLREIEKSAKMIESSLMTKTEAQEKAATRQQVLKSAISNFEAEHSKLHEQLMAQLKAVQVAKKAADDCKQLLKDSLDKFWTTVETQFTCKDATELASAVGNVFMMTQPEAGILAKIGGGLSVGASFSGIGKTVQTAEGSVDKEVLNGKMFMLQADLDDAGLKSEITAKNKEILSLSGADQGLLNAIVVSRAAFERLCNQYFSSKELIGAVEDKYIKEAKHQFDTYVDRCQDLHTAVIEYNTTAVQIARLEADNRRNESRLSELQNNQFSDTLPWLDMLMAFYAELILFQKAEAVRFLFAAVRACNAIFLERLTVLDPLWELGTFDNFTGDQLHAACFTHLVKDVGNFQSTWNRNKPKDILDRTTIMKENSSEKERAWPSVFRNLKESRRFTLYITPETAVTDHGFDPQWYDIRLQDLRIHLIGATNKKANSTAESKVVDVHVTLGGPFSVLDENYKEYTFEVPRTTDTYSYSYDKAPQSYENISKNSLGNKVLSNFNLALFREQGDPITFSLPMQSPLGKYIFTVSENIEVKDVEEIRLHLDLAVRTSSVPRTQQRT